MLVPPVPVVVFVVVSQDTSMSLSFTNKSTCCVSADLFFTPHVALFSAYLLNDFFKL